MASEQDSSLGQGSQQVGVASSNTLRVVSTSCQCGKLTGHISLVSQQVLGGEGRGKVLACIPSPGSGAHCKLQQEAYVPVGMVDSGLQFASQQPPSLVLLAMRDK